MREQKHGHWEKMRVTQAVAANALFYGRHYAHAIEQWYGKSAVEMRK